jgi:hypothetical protein
MSALAPWLIMIPFPAPVIVHPRIVTVRFTLMVMVFPLLLLWMLTRSRCPAEDANGVTGVCQGNPDLDTCRLAAPGRVDEDRRSPHRDARGNERSNGKDHTQTP